MSDAAAILVFMGIVVGLAAAILWLLDKLTLRGLTEEERKASVDQRTARWQKRWIWFYVAIAVISLPINFFLLIKKKEPFFPTIIWIVLALLIVLGVLNPY